MPKDGTIKCRWCGEFFDEGDVSIEQQAGPLCDNCVAELQSRGERPCIVHGMSYAEWLEKKPGRTKRKGE